MTALNIYLTFNGNCEDAFNFYKSVFGGDFDYVGRFKDMPEDPNCKIDEADKNKIMHISYRFQKDAVLMGSDTGGEWAPDFKQGNNFSLSINADSKEEADSLFAKLSQNGQVTMPMEMTFWNSYFGMFTDQFGIQWMISFDEPNREKH